MAPRRLWHEAADPGSSVWDDTVDEHVSLGTTLDPSLAVYVASRDAAQARGREYHRDYTTPQAWKFFQPNPESHGSYFQDWGTEEVAWKENYRLWMAFVRDFYHRGGRVTVGSDRGFIYNLYGFGLVEEMELLPYRSGDAPSTPRRSSSASASVCCSPHCSAGSSPPS
ncbi:hypothetical protein ABT218_25075 [Streptomyces sp. NPDC001455]|uniref:hypothetical protein n=1 Tax=unclassified Streptomyces TaxID=2593676 RepID=UPI0033294234